MDLLVVSHKETWLDSASPSSYITIGGFPFQMQAISTLFDNIKVMVPVRKTSPPPGAVPIEGHNLQVLPLPEPAGKGLYRKFSLLAWLPFNFLKIWSAVSQADAVHTPVPGDIGTLGFLVALAQRKPLFVRHCGNWSQPRTIYERFLIRSIEKFARGKNVMFATGSGPQSPSEHNHKINWIFSTSLSERELEKYRLIKKDKFNNPPTLVITCRQELDKGTDVVIKSLKLISKRFPEVKLEVIGDGASLKDFMSLAGQLNLSDRVRFHGNVNHKTVLEILQRADIFCYPTSASEGFPKSVLEAMACGLPVVTTRISVLPSLIANRCGTLLEKPDPEELALAVINIFSKPDLYKKMSHNAQVEAGTFSLERWAQTIGIKLESSWGLLQEYG